MMGLHIESFRVTGVSDLAIRFDNGEELQVSLEKELYGEVFEPLRSADFFRKAYLNPDTRTIEWPNGADFAPEFLYALARQAAVSSGRTSAGWPT